MSENNQMAGQVEGGDTTSVLAERSGRRQSETYL